MDQGFFHLYDVLHKQEGVCPLYHCRWWLRVKLLRSLKMIVVKDEERVKEVFRDRPSKSTPVTLGWALLPSTCTRGNGRGWGSTHKKCSNTGKRVKENKKPQAGGNRNRKEGWKLREWDTLSRSHYRFTFTKTWLKQLTMNNSVKVIAKERFWNVKLMQMNLSHCIRLTCCTFTFFAFQKTL